MLLQGLFSVEMQATNVNIIQYKHLAWAKGYEHIPDNPSESHAEGIPAA